MQLERARLLWWPISQPELAVVCQAVAGMSTAALAERLVSREPHYVAAELGAGTLLVRVPRERLGATRGRRRPPVRDR